MQPRVSENFRKRNTLGFAKKRVILAFPKNVTVFAFSANADGSESTSVLALNTNTSLAINNELDFAMRGINKVEIRVKSFEIMKRNVSRFAYINFEQTSRVSIESSGVLAILNEDARTLVSVYVRE